MTLAQLVILAEESLSARRRAERGPEPQPASLADLQAWGAGA